MMAPATSLGAATCDGLGHSHRFCVWRQYFQSVEHPVPDSSPTTAVKGVDPDKASPGVKGSPARASGSWGQVMPAG